MSWGVATQNGVSVSLASIVSLSCGATEFSPASLFTTGVAGAWYDPSDINNYMAGLGPELVTNGDFASGTTGWAVYPGLAPDTFEVVDGELHIANDGSTRGLSGTASAAGPSVVAGVTYKVTFTLRVVTASGNASVQLNANYFSISRLSLISNIASNYPVGTYEITRYYTATNTELLTFSIDSAVGAVSDLYFDNISVKQVTTIANATLFQDSAGTTPVTAVEQPVGLMLDKSQGLVLGSELVTNGDFSGGTTGWTAGNSATLSVTGGKLSVVNGALALGQGRQTITTVAGKTYKISVTFTSVSASRGYIFVGTFAGDNSRFSAGPLTTSQTVTGYFTAAGTSTYISIGNADNSIGLEVQFDDVTVKELPGNHASQATSASRPVLRARYNSLLYSETFSNAAWQSASSGTAAAGVKTPNFGTAPDGTQTACRIQLDVSAGSTGNQSQIYQNYACAVGNLTYQCYVKTNDGSTKTIQPFTATGASITVTGTWQLFTFTRSSGATTDNFQFILVKGTTSDTADLLVWHPQSNPGSSAGTYQRIAAATDYATAGFLPYLYFITDDSFGTNSIDFTATENMAVCVGLQNAAANGMVMELSADATANAGTFYLYNNNSSTKYDFLSRGSLGGGVSSYTYTAPDVAVLTGAGKISTNSNVLRRNGVQVGTASNAQGTGNFGNYPLYIGRRNNATLPFEGRVYQLVVVGKTLSASELASTEAYVNARTGAY